VRFEPLVRLPRLYQCDPSPTLPILMHHCKPRFEPGLCISANSRPDAPRYAPPPPPPPPSGPAIQTDLSLNGSPTLIRSGNGANVSWSSTNMTSCVVTSDDNDHWPASSNDAALQSPIGGETSNPNTVLTTFTLICMGADGVSKSQQVQVDIIPVFQEI
jgi:hypothetical protein